MKKVLCLLIIIFLFTMNTVYADPFGTGDNQFTIDFVTISGATYPPDYGDIDKDYRVGTYEITNSQWTKFKAAYGTVTGDPPEAYDQNPFWTGSNVPTNAVSVYEAAQFVNWLNTSTGHYAAYKFTGTQGTSDYSLDVWQPGDDGYDASNPNRNSKAYYFLPTEEEWYKAAYWNGTAVQTFATIGDTVPVAGTDSNYNGYLDHPWNIGSGNEELNGTYDMMGNVWELMENNYDMYGSLQCVRGGSYYLSDADDLKRYTRIFYDSYVENWAIGFRVFSVPEPATSCLLALGAMLAVRKRRN